MFKAALFSILGDNIVDPYMAFDHGKDAWDALEAKFGVSDAGTELYVMEQYYDYGMTMSAPWLSRLMRFSPLPKNSSSLSVPYRTSLWPVALLPSFLLHGGTLLLLKHKRQEFSVSDLIGSLHVEEKARAKDTRARSFEGGSSANVVQKKNFQSHKSKNKNNGKGKFDEKNKASNSTNFKKKTPYKKKGNCHVCGAPGHWAPDCPERHDRRGNSGKSANVVIGVDTEMKDVGYGCKDLLRADGKRLTCFCSWCCQKGRREGPLGPDHRAARPGPGRATLCWGAHDLFASFSSRTPSSRKPKPRGILTKGYAASGAESTERKELSAGEIRGKFPPGGEIDAIAIVIELDIISIIITIVSTIYTAITTAAPRHRCNDLGLILIV
ncbi:hypothetical protein QYE76_027411 [Lolium multiflorum]|uniref:CCHC-type domain-containing protein n=1 Tax=Lolium multiflorum TaxID=4521 RepID=A0AAD8VG21_LOLMU|nr:hypothetical protein QYE76_027411 [Lolium multiflorum]